MLKINIPVLIFVLQFLTLCLVCLWIYINGDLRHRLREQEKKLKEMEEKLNAAGI